MSPLVHAVAARTALHRGDVARAQDHLAPAAHLRPRLIAGLPHRAVQTLLELVRAHLALTDVAGARTVLREARIILHQRADLGTLPAQAAQLQSKLDAVRETTTSAATLTSAELRLLPLLSTHLTFREIGERFCISQHTVKCQAVSVYANSASPPAARPSSASSRPAWPARRLDPSGPRWQRTGAIKRPAMPTEESC